MIMKTSKNILKKKINIPPSKDNLKEDSVNNTLSARNPASIREFSLNNIDIHPRDSKVAFPSRKSQQFVILQNGILEEEKPKAQISNGVSMHRKYRSTETTSMADSTAQNSVQNSNQNSIQNSGPSNDLTLDISYEMIQHELSIQDCGFDKYKI